VGEAKLMGFMGSPELVTEPSQRMTKSQQGEKAYAGALHDLLGLMQFLSFDI
jgi:hypothetical protein